MQLDTSILFLKKVQEERRGRKGGGGRISSVSSSKIGPLDLLKLIWNRNLGHYSLFIIFFANFY